MIIQFFVKPFFAWCKEEETSRGWHLFVQEFHDLSPDPAALMLREHGDVENDAPISTVGQEPPHAYRVSVEFGEHTRVCVSTDIGVFLRVSLAQAGVSKQLIHLRPVNAVQIIMKSNFVYHDAVFKSLSCDPNGIAY